MFCGDKVTNLSAKNMDYFLLTIYIYGSGKKSDKKRKISIEDEQTSAELSSAHRRLEAKCRLVQTSYIKRINSSCVP